MLRVGLTGTMGSGKSTVGRLLAARGATVIDADELARALTAPGTEGHAAVLARFGPPVTAGNGTLDRKALASVVFNDPAQLADLEGITHPLVTHELEQRLAVLGHEPFVVIELPLLDEESRRRLGIDIVILVETDSEVAVQRAAQRGLGPDDVRARQRNQPDEAERRAMADKVLHNNTSMSQLAAAVDELWPFLVERAEQAGERGAAQP